MTTVEKIHVLVVEDNDASASDYVRALEEAGYHVNLVERAEQFLGFLHGYRPARA